MGKVCVTEDYLQDIADAIRAKGVEGTFTPAQMANAIRSISGGGATAIVVHLYDGREDQYNSDTSNTPMLLEDYTEAAEFSNYLSTADHKTFTVLQDFFAIISYGVRQAGSSSNKPNCTFYVNNTETFYVEALSTQEGYESSNIAHDYIELHTGDTFFWGSNNNRGYAARIGAVDVISDVDLSGYSEPEWE